VERALVKWRGSTVAGYLRGEDRTYRENFRCSKHRFDDNAKLYSNSLVLLLAASLRLASS